MIRENDLLSEQDNLELDSEARGFVVKCDSPSGICFDCLETKNAFHGQIRGNFPKRKPRAKFYLQYTSKVYKKINDSWNKIRRTEVYLPDDTLIFVNDCVVGHGQCGHMQTIQIAELFEEYRNQEYRKKKPSMKPKRKPVKKIIRKSKKK